MTAPYTSQQNGLSANGSVGNAMAVVRLPDLKLKTFGERGIKCIIVAYAEHSKAFWFFVIEPNELVSINFIIESRNVIFNENRFSSIPRPSLSIPKGTKDISGSVVPKKDVAFWKEAINDEMDSIMGNNTWVLDDLHLGCKPLGCKWIFKRKLKVDGTIEKFKARLVIQGFRQKSGIDYFDTYAPVARISTIRLLIAMESIHNLIIHQMDVKTAFLNGELEEEVDLTKDLLSSRFSMKDMGEANVILVPMDTSEKLMPNNGQAISQLEYSRVIGCLVYAMTCTQPDIVVAVGKQLVLGNGKQFSGPICRIHQGRYGVSVPALTKDHKGMKLNMPLKCLELIVVTDQPVPVSQAETPLLPVRIRFRTNIVRMTKVIKGEFEKIKDVKFEDVLLTCDTSLEVFNNEVNRLSGMGDDLFTYEVEVANIPCDSKMDNDSEHEADDDIGYDPSDVAFTKWLGSKFFNYNTMDHYTMKVLWIYWIRGDDRVELTDEEFSDNEDEVVEVFRIDTNIFYFETPMCKAFKEFNYLLQIDPDLHTKDIEGFKTYEDYKDDWIYEWNKDVPWIDEKPWTNAGVWTKPTPDDAYETNHGDNKSKELCEVHELSMCNIRRYMMIKYLFINDEEYVAVKEDEYNDPTITREEACRAYQEIFQKMDEG
ncbi:zinc finger, CCHC-type containing protein [Tanacetum coccineum]